MEISTDGLLWEDRQFLVALGEFFYFQPNSIDIFPYFPTKTYGYSCSTSHQHQMWFEGEIRKLNFVGKALFSTIGIDIVSPQKCAGLVGSVGCAVRLETRRLRVQPPPMSATFFRGD